MHDPENHVTWPLGLECVRLLRVPGRLGGWSIRRSIPAQVVILQFVGSNPLSDSVLTGQSLLEVLSPPLFLPLPCVRAHTRSLSKEIKKHENKPSYQVLAYIANPNNGPENRCCICSALSTGATFQD